MKAIKDIQAICEQYSKVAHRAQALTQSGYNVKRGPMGSGGKYQVKTMADGTKRVQIGYGIGRFNYAFYVELGA